MDKNSISRDSVGRFRSLLTGKTSAPKPQVESIITRKKSSDKTVPIEHPLLLDENFMRVYRGLNQAPHDEGFGFVADALDEEYFNRGLGMHWTPSLKAADFFAVEIDVDDTDWDRKYDYGIVLEAVVHVDSIVWPGTDEWNKLARENDIYTQEEDTGSFEQEVTVRPGSQVIVIAQHNVGKIRRDDVVRKVIPLNEPLVRKA